MPLAVISIASLRRLAAVLALLAVAGCSTAPSPLAANSDYDSDRRMFNAAYEDIDELYIRPVDLKNLAVGGLSALAKLDDKLAVKQESGQIDLLYGGDVEAVFATTPQFKADDWAALTANGIAAARKASPAVAKADSEVVYQTVFGGILARLEDPFTRYAGRAQAAENRASREGFGGLGIHIAVEDGAVRITSVQHYTPAERAGLRAEDLIDAVDGVSTKGLDQAKVIGMLRGDVNSRVVLTVKRPGTAEPLSFAITRALVIPESVTYRREGDIAYFRIYNFNEDTAGSLRREFENARSDIGGGLRGIVIDLRDDPGGLLDQAVASADLFIDGGPIVSTHGRNPESHQHYEATAGDITDGLPIAVLINGDSASASEILAAALQDSERAVLIGSNSYGKGTVQQVQTLPNSGELTITWARYYAPSGYTLNHIGVLPSICTNKGDQDATDILSQLSGGRLSRVPVTARNATSPDDTAALDKLRLTCPADKEQPAVDLQVALRLLRQPRLYAEALALAVPPGASPNAQSALTQDLAKP
jgi:carboxyl-terminal processing protease